MLFSAVLEHSPDFSIVRVGWHGSGQNRQRHHEYYKSGKHDNSKDPFLRLPGIRPRPSDAAHRI